MPAESYHGSDGRALGRRLRDLDVRERMQVNCRPCGRTTVYGHETFRSFRTDCPTVWLEADLPPRCWKLTGCRPADCQREVTWPDMSPEDVGCSDEG